MIEKFLTFFLIAIYALTGLVNSCHSANNIAEHKKYVISSPPNYPLTASATDSTALTDGEYTVGHFWTKKTTVGWQETNPVEILIDLGQISVIERITFNSARGINAGVNFPAQIDAYIGSDKDHFSYAGDLANNSDNTPGTYKVKKFKLQNIGRKGRYVLLEVVPKGKFVFCDEIEVLGPVSAKNDSASGDSIPIISIDQARHLTNQARRLNIEKEFLRSLVETIKSPKQGSLQPVNDIKEIGQKIIAIKSPEDSKTFESEVLKLRGKFLRQHLPGKDILIQNVNPWIKPSPIQLPQNVSSETVLITMPQNGYGHGALLLTNLSSDEQQISISTGHLPDSAPELSVYQVPFVKSAAMEYVADPVVPISAGFALRPGESRLLFITGYGMRPGAWKSTIKFVHSQQSSIVPLELHVANISVPEKLTLNSINWGYLDFNSIKNRKDSAMKDLKAHHTSVAVVPPNYLPFSDQTSPYAMVRLEKYLKLHKGMSKIIFFLDLSHEKSYSKSGGHHFMSEEWQSWFKKLYERHLKIAKLSGFTEDQIYIYPYDEVAGNDVDRFVALASWARTEIPSIKFYATLSNKKSLRVLPYIQIAQIINDPNLLAEVTQQKNELWIYGTKENSKSLSPYSYYRLLPWKAFSLGFTGAGFWNYADTGWGNEPGSAWDDFDGNRPDFAVIYEGENGSIISSRRWEAWRMGVEDYELLTMYAKSKGEMSAKALAKSVLDNPQDLGRADQVRQKILRELSR